jgi:hypothetical protein
MSGVDSALWHAMRLLDSLHGMVGQVEMMVAGASDEASVVDEISYAEHLQGVHRAGREARLKLAEFNTELLAAYKQIRLLEDQKTRE